jgi:hypothetical protein
MANDECYRQQVERRSIERLSHAKDPVDEMARVSKRCRSTIFRELKRNHFSDESMPKCDGDYGAAAHVMHADLQSLGNAGMGIRANKPLWFAQPARYPPKNSIAKVHREVRDAEFWTVFPHGPAGLGHR